MGAFVVFIRRCVDRLLLLQARLAARRDLLAQLNIKIETERERHQREEDRLKDEIKARDKQIEMLAAIISKHLGILDREIAINSRLAAEAQHNPPGSK